MTPGPDPHFPHPRAMAAAGGPFGTILYREEAVRGGGAGDGGGAGRVVAVVALNRPARFNAVTDTMYSELTEVLRRTAEAEAVVALVLTGTGQFFTAGQDLTNASSLAVGSRDGGVPGSSFAAPVGRFMVAMIEFPKPVICVVNGPAVGVGATLLPHCDVVLACEGAWLWTPFVRIAVVPEFCSSVLFPRLLGASTANEMLLFERRLGVEEARERGLVSRVFSTQADAMAAAAELVAAVAAHPFAGESTRLFKRLIGNGTRQGLVAVCREELDEMDRRVRAGQTQQAAAAFLSRKLASQSKL